MKNRLTEEEKKEKLKRHMQEFFVTEKEFREAMGRFAPILQSQGIPTALTKPYENSVRNPFDSYTQKLGKDYDSNDLLEYKNAIVDGMESREFKNSFEEMEKAMYSYESLTRQDMISKDLTSESIKPIQRMQRYIILLEPIIDTMTSLNMDATALIIQKGKMKMELEAINEVKRMPVARQMKEDLANLAGKDVSEETETKKKEYEKLIVETCVETAKKVKSNLKRVEAESELQFMKRVEAASELQFIKNVEAAFLPIYQQAYLNGRYKGSDKHTHKTDDVWALEAFFAKHKLFGVADGTTKYNEAKIFFEYNNVSSPAQKNLINDLFNSFHDDLDKFLTIVLANKADIEKFLATIHAGDKEIKELRSALQEENPDYHKIRQRLKSTNNPAIEKHLSTLQANNDAIKKVEQKIANAIKVLNRMCDHEKGTVKAKLDFNELAGTTDRAGLVFDLSNDMVYGDIGEKELVRKIRKGILAKPVKTELLDCWRDIEEKVPPSASVNFKGLVESEFKHPLTEEQTKKATAKILILSCLEPYVGDRKPVWQYVPYPKRTTLKGVYLTNIENFTIRFEDLQKNKGANVLEKDIKAKKKYNEKIIFGEFTNLGNKAQKEILQHLFKIISQITSGSNNEKMDNQAIVNTFKALKRMGVDKNDNAIAEWNNLSKTNHADFMMIGNWKEKEWDEPKLLDRVKSKAFQQSITQAQQSERMSLLRDATMKGSETSSSKKTAHVGMPFHRDTKLSSPTNTSPASSDDKNDSPDHKPR